MENLSMRQKRRDRGYRLTELRNLTGVSISNLSQIESGKQRPQKFTRQRIEEILGSVDWGKTLKEPHEQLADYEY